MSRLGLGTVQFGMPYGITNSSGQVPQAEVVRILKRARDHGIDVLDTAALYGESEKVLGDSGAAELGFKIVTKTGKFGDLTSTKLAVEHLEKTFAASIAELNQTSIYGLLAHDAYDLLGVHGVELFEAMRALKARGLVDRIGASVYSGEQIDALLDRFELDLVQLPINAVDRRLVDGGQLKHLADRGVEIHARSIFLQGLLLQKPEKIDPWFGNLRNTVTGLHSTFSDLGLTPIEGLLGAVLQHQDIARIIVGVTSAAELDELVAAASKGAVYAGCLDIDRWAITDDNILSPANWPNLQTEARH